MEILHFSKEQINNMNILNNGGFEGRILIYETYFVIKYFEDYFNMNQKAKENKYYKLQRLYDKNLPNSLLAKPLALVYVDGNFSGYLMNKIPDALTIDNIINYKQILKMYIELFSKLEILHSNNIIVGDLKPANIVEGGNGEHIFVDSDSMGIDELLIEYENRVPRYAEKDKQILKKLQLNDRKLIDKLLLFYCFLNSISKDKNKNFNYSYIIGTSNLSDHNKVLLTKFINQLQINMVPNFVSILNKEKARGL